MMNYFLKNNIFLFFVIFHSNYLYAKNVVVTGGAGFIGSHVAQYLLARGDNVFILDNMNNFYDPLLKFYNIESIRKSILKTSGRFQFLHVDVSDLQALDCFFKKNKIDVICHLAARAGVQPSIDDPLLYAKANVSGTIAMLEMAKKYNINHVVLASSSSVYGSSSSVPFSEDCPADLPCSPYAATKRMTELLASTYHHLYNISCTCLRFFTVYGPRGRVDMSPFKFLDAIYNGTQLTLYGDGSAIRDYTYVDDIVSGVVAAIDMPVGFEVVNLGRGEPIILKEFIETIEDIVGKKANVVYQSMRQGDVPITHADVSKAQRLFGYAPHVSVKEGMQKMYDWYVSEFLPRNDLVRSSRFNE